MSWIKYIRFEFCAILEWELLPTKFQWRNSDRVLSMPLASFVSISKYLLDGIVHGACVRACVRCFLSCVFCFRAVSLFVGVRLVSRRKFCAPSGEGLGREMSTRIYTHPALRCVPPSVDMSSLTRASTEQPKDAFTSSSLVATKLKLNWIGISHSFPNMFRVGYVNRL